MTTFTLHLSTPSWIPIAIAAWFIIGAGVYMAYASWRNQGTIVNADALEAVLTIVAWPVALVSVVRMLVAQRKNDRMRPVR